MDNSSRERLLQSSFAKPSIYILPHEEWGGGGDYVYDTSEKEKSEYNFDWSAISINYNAIG